jgi:hypothetical protein
VQKRIKRLAVHAMFVDIFDPPGFTDHEERLAALGGFVEHLLTPGSTQ